MYVFPVAVFPPQEPVVERPSSGTQCSKPSVSHSATVHAYISHSLVFIKFTPPAPSIPNESCLFHRHDDD